MNNGTIDYDSMSRIKVAGSDSRISNQDARTTYVAAGENDFKRTSDLMLGNDGKALDDATYINASEFLSAAEALFSSENVKKIVMTKTGKKIKPEELAKIVEATKESCRIVVAANSKVQNQDARSISVKTPNMTEEKVVAGAFLGKNGVPLSNGDYVKKEDVEFTVVPKKKGIGAIFGKDVPISNDTPVKQENIEYTITKKKKVVANVSTKAKLAKGLGTLAVTAGLVALVPFIMHANSVMWHHAGPEVQEFLHTINSGLGEIVNYTYDGHGLWTTANGALMNADAPTASMVPAILTYGLTGAGITKLVADIKSGVVTVKNAIKGKNKENEEGKSL